MESKHRKLLEFLRLNMSDMLSDPKDTAWFSEVLEMYALIDESLKDGDSTE